MNPMVKIQADAAREAMQAKQEFEIEDQQRKVSALGEQARTRANQLVERAKQVEYDALYADERPFYVGANYFGGDTVTLDALLSQLAEESQTLANMRAAKEKTGELHEKFEARIEAEMPGEAVVLPDGVDPSAFEMPPVGSGAYL